MRSQRAAMYCRAGHEQTQRRAQTLVDAVWWNCGRTDAQAVQEPAAAAPFRAANWTRHAAALNGLPAVEFPAHDYVNNLVSWRRNHVVDMCEHIQQCHGKHWLAAIASRRSFSECQIYGAYVDGVKSGQGHFAGQGALCQTYWSGEALNRDSLQQFIGTMSPAQVAIGVQSFTGTSPELLREIIAA